MQYLITFLEGIISFISPCVLPLLPVYVSYFAGGGQNNKSTFARAVFFVIGFTLVFCLLGLFAGGIGAFVSKYQTGVNIVCGLIVIAFGLNFLDIIKIPIFKGISRQVEITGVFSAFIFGVVFSLSLTPCVGAFLGSALMMASSVGGAFEGTLLLLAYSLGMGIPFLVSALIIGKLVGFFAVIKKHYKIINIVCGSFLVIIGLVMMTGKMTLLLSFSA